LQPRHSEQDREANPDWLGDQAALHGAIAVALREAHALLFTRAARCAERSRRSRC
jgi:hypothetical protein